MSLLWKRLLNNAEQLVYAWFFYHVFLQYHLEVLERAFRMPTYNLPVAPVVAPKVSDPINLGEFDSRYEGWLVVIDLDTTLEVNELISQVSDDASPLKERTEAMTAWLAAMIVAWNFVDDQGAPLPQPRDGGVAKCKQELIQPISQAIAQAISPKKS